MGRTSIFQALRMREEEAEQEAPAPVVKPYEGSYADKLRVVGRHFDRNDHGSVSIMEVPGGLLARVMNRDGVEDLVEFPDDAFPGLYQEVVTSNSGVTDGLRIKSDLIPTSYEEVLWALGGRLDEWAARSLVFAECQPYLFVTGQRLVDSSMHSRYADFQEVLYPADVDVLITEFQQDHGAQ